MGEPAWWEGARRLARRVVEVAGEVPDRDPGAWLAARVDERAGDVVTTRFASGEEAASLDPTAMLDPHGPVWTDRAGDADAATIGFDEGGAVATVHTQSRWGGHRAVGVGRRDPDGTELLIHVPRPRAHEVSARTRLAGGPTVVVRVEWERGDDDEPLDPEVHIAVAMPAVEGRVRVERARIVLQGWEPGRPAVAILAADEVRLGDDGAPGERLVDRTTRPDLAGGRPTDAVEVVAPCAGDPVSLLEHGLRALGDAGARGTATVPLWSRRLHGGWASQAPEADDMEEAATAMRDLVVDAVAGVDLAEPCALVMDWWTGDTRRSPPLPGLTVLGGEWRDRWRRLPSQWPAIANTREAVAQGEGLVVDLAAVASDRLLELWAPLRRAWWNAPGTTAPERIAAGVELARVRRRLLELLLEVRWPTPWAGRVTPWLSFGPPGAGHDPADEREGASVQPEDELHEVGGSEVAARLREEWPVERAGTAGLPRVAEAPDGTPVPTDLEASTSRGALRRLLEHEGLAESAGALAARARWGWAMTDQRAAERPPRSRIGGVALLPPGVPWPTTAEGEALTFLAVVDLADARDVDEPTVLPTDGLLLVFLLVGSIDPEEGILEFVEHEPAGETATVFHLPPGTAPVEVPDPPAKGLVHDGYHDEGPVLRPFGLRPVLVPRDDWVAGQEVGLHPSEQERYQELVWRVTAAGQGEDTSLDAAGNRRFRGDEWPGDHGDRNEGSWADDEPDHDDPETDGAPETATLNGGHDGPEGRSVLSTLATTGEGGDPGVESQADAWRRILEGFGGLPADAAELTADELRAVLMERIEAQDDDETEDEPEVLPQEAFGVLLGDAPGSQGCPAEDGELVLLSLDGSADLGLDWGDGGDVRILIREEDATAGRWDRAWATGDSG